jgi:putative transcriptional regulator
MARLSPELQNTVAAARKDAGLTQQHLARAVGVSRQTIVEIEAGGYNPSTVLALRLATILGTSVDQLFHLPDEETAALTARNPRTGTTHTQLSRPGQ